MKNLIRKSVMTSSINERKHTPIVSRKQQKLFGMWKSNPSTKPKSITGIEVESHLKESKGKFKKGKKKK